IMPGSGFAVAVKGRVQELGFEEIDAALDLYEQAVTLDPRTTLAYASTARVHLREKQDLDAFIADAEGRRAAMPGQAWTHGTVAFAYLEKDAVEDGITAFESLLALVPNYADAHCELARLYERTLQKQQATEHWGLCALLDSRNSKGTEGEGERTELLSIEISAPLDGAEVSGLVEIRGSAWINDFQFYKVEFGAGEHPDTWSVIGDVQETSVMNGTLALWDTS